MARRYHTRVRSLALGRGISPEKSRAMLPLLGIRTFRDEPYTRDAHRCLPPLESRPEPDSNRVSGGIAARSKDPPGKGFLRCPLRNAPRAGRTAARGASPPWTPEIRHFLLPPSGRGVPDRDGNDPLRGEQDGH